MVASCMRPYLMLIACTALLCSCSSSDSDSDSQPFADGGEIAEGDGSQATADASPDAPVTDPCGMPSNVARVDFSHEGRSRGAEISLPNSYNGQSTPVVINFHGRNSTVNQHRLMTQMDADATSLGFIAVYPEGIGNTFNAGLCCGEAQSQNINDVDYTRVLVDELAKELCIDRSKMYATGLSNGGYMTQRLACEAPDLFAGYASIAGLLVAPACTPSEPKPIVHFHGTADAIVPYDGNAFLQSAQQTMDGWAARNGCNGTTSEVFSQGDASCVAYDGCPMGAEVELCTIDGGGHTWPGGFPVPALGSTSTDISANQYMWQFFAAP